MPLCFQALYKWRKVSCNASEQAEREMSAKKNQQIGLHLTEVSSIVHSTSTPVYAARMEPRERCEHPSVHAQGIWQTWVPAHMYGVAGSSTVLAQCSCVGQQHKRLWISPRSPRRRPCLPRRIWILWTSSGVPMGCVLLLCIGVRRSQIHMGSAAAYLCATCSTNLQ